MEHRWQKKKTDSGYNTSILYPTCKQSFAFSATLMKTSLDCHRATKLYYNALTGWGTKFVVYPWI